MKFDVMPSGCSDVVKDDGMEIHRRYLHTYTKLGRAVNSSRFMIGCSRGFNEGINEWRIETLQDHNEEIIGITTAIADCKKLMWIGYAKGNTYYYYGGDKAGNGACVQSNVNGHRKFYSVDAYKWKRNDVISVKVNCDKWTVSFKLNGTLVGED
eukprot:510230_1